MIFQVTKLERDGDAAYYGPFDLGHLCIDYAYDQQFTGTAAAAAQRHAPPSLPAPLSVREGSAGNHSYKSKWVTTLVVPDECTFFEMSTHQEMMTNCSTRHDQTENGSQMAVGSVNSSKKCKIRSDTWDTGEHQLTKQNRSRRTRRWPRQSFCPPKYFSLGNPHGSSWSNYVQRAACVCFAIVRQKMIL